MIGFHLIFQSRNLFTRLILINNTTRLSDPDFNFRFRQIACQDTKVKDIKDELTREISLPLDIVNHQIKVAKVKAVNFKVNKQSFKKSKIKP